MRRSKLKMFTTRAPWPTTTTGDPVTDLHALRADLDRHMVTASTERLDNVTFLFESGSTRELGYATLDGQRGADEQESYIHVGEQEPDADVRAELVGRAVLTDALESCLARLLVELEEHRAELTFDGTQWWLTQSAMEDHDSYPGELSDIDLLEESGFGTEPVGGGTHTSVPLLAAVSAVADEFAAAALQALREAGVDDDALTSAQNALTAKAQNLGHLAQVMGHVMKQVGVDRPSPFEE